MSSARLRFLTARANWPLRNSTKRSIQIQRIEWPSLADSNPPAASCARRRLPSAAPKSVPSGGFQLALNVAGDQIDREQVAEVLDRGVGLELAQVGKRHARAQLVETLGGHAAILDQ